MRLLFINQYSFFEQRIAATIRQFFFLIVFTTISLCGFSQSSSSVSCPPNLNFSYGNFTNWQCYKGIVKATINDENLITVTASVPDIDRHKLIHKQTPSLVDVYGLFPTTPINGSDYVLKLGNDKTNNEAERVQYKLKIPNNITNFSVIYQYAVVLEDPNHKVFQQPRLNVKWIDSATGNILACPSVEFVVSSVLPGFFPSKKYRNAQDTVWYKPWSQVYVNLTPFAGKTVYLEVTTADCTLSAHFGYGYFDIISCGENDVIPQYYCTNPSSIKVNGPPGFQTYNWWNANFTTLLATGISATINPSPPINSSINLEIIPYNGYGCRDTIHAKPIIPGNILANAGLDKIICGSGSTQIGNVPVVYNSYSWLPNTFISDATSSAPIVDPPTPQDYYLTVYDSSTFCTNHDTVRVDVLPKPVFDFTILDSIQCINDEFSFTSNITSPYSNLLWSFSDNTNSTLTNPSHLYTNNGNQSVKLLVTSTNTCKDSLTKNVFIYSKPKTNLSVNAANQCFRDNNFSFSNTYFSNNGTLHYNWNFGDNTTVSTQANTQHNYAQSGNYSIRLLVKDSLGCFDSTVIPIQVYHQPKADFVVNNAAQCLNINNFIFSNSSYIKAGNLSYAWNFGDGVGTSNTTNPTYQYSNFIKTNVILIATSANSCNDTISKQVTIFPKPNSIFTIDTNALCLVNNHFIFSNKSTIQQDTLTKYVWNFGDGNSTTTLNAQHSYVTSGNFIAALLVMTNNGCKDSIQLPVKVFAMPKVDIEIIGRKNICIGDTSKLIAHANAGSGFITSYKWFENSIAMIGSIDSTINVFKAGNFDVSVSNSNGCNTQSVLVPITINPYPVSSISQPNTYNICEGSSIHLATNGAANYQWFLNGDSIIGATTNAIDAVKQGNYSVRLTSQFGCVSYANNNISLKYFAKPISIFSYDKYCVNTFINFNNNSTYTVGDSVLWQWDFGDGHSSKLFNPSHYYSIVKNYSVSLKATSTVCSQLQNISTQNISVIAPINNLRYPTVNALTYKPQPLSARDIGTNYTWKPAHGLSNINTYNPIFNDNREQQYVINILLPSGCKIYDTLLVRIFEDGDIFVPKAFTPNNDGHNDNLYPLIVGTTQLKMFRIFNRWGQLMFETTTPKYGWNGLFNNNPQPMDTYTWTVEAIGFNGKLIRRSGNSVLIR